MPPILSTSPSNTVEALATRIEVQWDFRTNDGPVLFFFDRVDWDPKANHVYSREYDRTLRVQIKDLLEGEYTITDPFTGEQVLEPGWKLMALIKAATDRTWSDASMPAISVGAPKGTDVGIAPVGEVIAVP